MAVIKLRVLAEGKIDTDAHDTAGQFTYTNLVHTVLQSPVI